MHALSSPLLDTRDRVAALANLLSARNPSTVLDCGASAGKFTAAFLHEFPKAVVYAFEPHKNSAERLRRDFSSEERVVVEQIAVGNFNGPSLFHINKLPYTSSLRTRPASGRRYYPATDAPQEIAEIAVTKLDDYCRLKSLEKVDLLKMDIQGSELAALHGCENLLGQQRIEVIFTEVFFVPHYDGAAMFHEICSYLAGFRYGLFKLFPTREGRNGQLRLGDAIFISPRLREEVVDRFPEEP